jgi:hypothetical protein
MFIFSIEGTDVINWHSTNYARKIEMEKQYGAEITEQELLLNL